MKCSPVSQKHGLNIWAANTFHNYTSPRLYFSLWSSSLSRAYKLELWLGTTLPDVSSFPEVVSSCEAIEHSVLEFQHGDNPGLGYSSRGRPRLHQMTPHGPGLEQKQDQLKTEFSWWILIISWQTWASISSGNHYYIITQHLTITWAQIGGRIAVITSLEVETNRQVMDKLW